MAAKWKIPCIICGKKECFNDPEDITFAKWKILGWDIGSNTPVCVCNKCEYVVPKIPKYRREYDTTEEK